MWTTSTLLQTPPIAYVSQTTLERRRNQIDHRGAETPFHGHCRAGDKGYLLRNAKPAKRGARTQQARRRPARGRRQEQFKFDTGCAKSAPKRTFRPFSSRTRANSISSVLRAAKIVGLTAGASAPEILVEGVLDALRGLGPVELTTLPGVVEDIEFKLPAELNE